MHGSSWSYVPQGFPARSMSKVDRTLVDLLDVPTKEVEIKWVPENNVRSLFKSNEFTCPHGGLAFPHTQQVQRPNLMSCRNGTPTIISCLATLIISLHARCTSGICSSTSAQKTQSKEREAKSSFVASPSTVTTRGISKRGFFKSSAVTSEKNSVSSREKCPSLAPISSTDRRFLGSKRRRSFVRSFSSSLAWYFSSSLSTESPESGCIFVSGLIVAQIVHSKSTVWNHWALFIAANSSCFVKWGFRTMPIGVPRHADHRFRVDGDHDSGMMPITRSGMMPIS